MAGLHYAKAVDRIRRDLLDTLQHHGDEAAIEAAVGAMVGAVAALAATVGPQAAARAVTNIAADLSRGARPRGVTIQ